MKIYRKNSKKNPWRNTRNERNIRWDKIFGNILIISIPVMIMFLAFSLVLRSDELYEYNLKDSQSLQKIYKSVDEEELVKMINGFFRGETDDFQIKESVDYEPENVFGKADQKFALKMRDMANITFIVGIIGAVITVLMYFFLIRWRKKEVHMSSYKSPLYL